MICRWIVRWRETLIIVQPETVLGWHRQGWKTYWRWRSRQRGRGGRRCIDPEVRSLIRRMASENPLWGQRRIQAELVRLGFTICARTVAKYMRQPYDGTYHLVPNAVRVLHYPSWDLRGRTLYPVKAYETQLS